MAYVILTNPDHSLSAPKKERIMQRSKNVDILWFLVAPDYEGLDMANTTVMLEYVLPVSKKYETEILVLAKDGYKEYLKYVLPLDTKLTSESGKIELQLTYTNVDIDADGNSKQYVRKTSPITINIVPISAWSDIIPDNALSALDQRLIMMNSQMKAIDEYMNVLDTNKADNLKYNEDENSLQLLAGEKEIGNKVVLNDKTYDEDGVPVVDFGSTSGDTITPPENDDEDNVVEF